MKKFCYCIHAGLLAGLLAANPANAVEALSTQELMSHCAVYEQQPDGTDGVFCVRYIQGFIDGAVATDERVTYNVAEEYEGETFTERAIRTRLGDQIRRYGPSYYAEFCLGEPLPLVTVVRTIVQELKASKVVTEQALAREVVYDVLRQQYPCEAAR